MLCNSDGISGVHRVDLAPRVDQSLRIVDLVLPKSNRKELVLQSPTQRSPRLSLVFDAASLLGSVNLSA